MALTTVTTKTVKDRTRLSIFVGIGLAAVSLIFFAVGSSLESQMDDMLQGLPEAFTGLIGGTESNYAIAELFGLVAPIALLVVAIAGGVDAVAGEERNRTADLLLTQPVTRRHVVRSKAGVLAVNIGITAGFVLVGNALWATVIPLNGFDPSDAVGISIHLYFLGVAFGMFALAVGTSTGSPGAGMAAAGGLAVLANLTAGLLPLVEGLESGAKISPWYYYNGSNPIVNGLDLGHIGVLAAIAGVSFAVALVAVELRDIGSQRSGPRLKIPAVGMITRPKVGTVFSKALSERLTLITIVGGAVAGMTIAVSAMYRGMKDTLADFTTAFPESVLKLFGVTDFSTPEGWIQVELLSLMVPIAFLTVGIVMGTKAIAGNDARRTLSLVVASPIKRSRIITDHALAIGCAITALAAITWLGLVAGSAVGGLGLDPARLAASVAHIAMLGLFFGCLALAIGSHFSSNTTIKITIVVAIVTYFGDWLLTLRPRLEPFAVLSPWHYITAAEPLLQGANLWHIGVLAIGSAVAVAAAGFLFDRRELDS